MVVHSTEVYSSLDINHSPFNVGFPIELPEFNSHKYMATASWNGTARLWRIESLDELLARGCDWLKYYLASHPEALNDLKICQEARRDHK